MDIEYIFHPVGGEGEGVKGEKGGSLFYPATSFTVLEYMIICFKI